MTATIDRDAMRARVLAEIIEGHGFVNARQLDALAEYDPFRKVLVICNLCRFEAAAVYAKQIITYAKAAGDWCRYAELTGSDPAGYPWRAEQARETWQEAAKRATPSPFPAHCYGNEHMDDYHSDADPGL